MVLWPCLFRVAGNDTKSLKTDYANPQSLSRRPLWFRLSFLPGRSKSSELKAIGARLSSLLFRRSSWWAYLQEQVEELQFDSGNIGASDDRNRFSANACAASHALGAQTTETDSYSECCLDTVARVFLAFTRRLPSV